MTPHGTVTNPLRVAIIGSGPAAFYAAEHLLRQTDVVAEVDMYDRLPTPYGLVRGGVAPDHQKIKTVTKAFQQTAAHERFRFFGYVEFGSDVTLDDLRAHYHQVLFATGAQSDRRLGIPGEDLPGSHAATEFVAWYNGHPDYRHLQFDLSQEKAVVIGVGNVAIDVARILCRTPEELATTDIADYALEALRHSKIKEVYLLGRRGPAQAAFTNPEVKEAGELADADAVVIEEEVRLDPLSEALLTQSKDRTTLKKVEILQGYAKRQPGGKSRQLIFRFLVSPVEIHGQEKVEGLKLVKNVLEATDAGTLNAKPTDHYENLSAGLVFRSVGYRGVPLPDVPFHDRWGVILNEAGRVIDPESKKHIVGLYTAGWIKRGPSGVIGTNKPDAVETVNEMLEDYRNGATFTPSAATAQAALSLVRERKPNYVSFDDWLKLDEMEIQRGQAIGRPRLKFTSVDDMLDALGKRVAMAQGG